jgi:hypothetical protein
MKEVIIRYGINEKKKNKMPRSVGFYKYYAEILGIQNSYTVEGESEILCVKIVESKITNPGRVKIKYERLDKNVILAE